ncbi:MAG TPA: CAP domain-containing protein [Labilithrix sp.]|nr:CAP domain-containing protein [Labilithrix sp.]
MKRYSKGSVVVALALSLSACSGTPQQPSTHAPAASSGAPIGSSAAPAAAPAPASVAAPLARPTKKLTAAEARRYMVSLVNRDRATQGLGPVELDEGPPTVAGQAHAEDMARLGYLGHWGSDGSVPEQRHSEAGGADMVLENALCFTDQAKRTLDPKPLIDPEQVERAESMFFDEVPPNDGHRKNILRPGHTRIGIGVAQPSATPTEIPVPCFAQELTDDYGTYTPIPKRAKVGTLLHVEGTLAPGVRPSGVGVARIPRPAPIAVSELNKRRSYPVPKPFQMYWGPGFVTPVPVAIDGTKLAVDVPLSDAGQPGLYEISVWAKLPGATEHAMIGLRTIVVE